MNTKEDNRINKTILVKRIADKTGIGQRQVRKVINEFLSEIAAELEQGNSVLLDSFGKFYVTQTKGRTLINKQKDGGIATTYSSNKRIGFTPSQKIKTKNKNILSVESLEDYNKRIKKQA